MEALAAGGQHLVRGLARRANEKDPAEAPFICAVGSSERVERLVRSASGARLLAGALSGGRPITDPETVTLDRAIELLAERRARGPAPSRKRRS